MMRSKLFRKSYGCARALPLIFMACVLAALLSITAHAQSLPKTLEISVDHSKTVQLDAPATTVSIANPDIADVQVMSPTTIMVFGKKIGQTSMSAVGSGNRLLYERKIRVTQDVSDITDALNALMPDNDIEIEAVPEGIVLKGSVTDARAAEDAMRVTARFAGKDGRVINRLRVTSSNQIQLRVRVAEVSRAVNRAFGINWNNAFKLSGFAFGIAQGANLVSNGLMGGLNTARPGDTENTINFGHREAGVDVNGFIDALAKDGLITVLAEPNLTALSGETASFLVGGEYPILIPQSNGTISIEYKDYGIKLAFTPTLVSDNRINLKVRPEVSELSDAGSVKLNNITVPSLKVRRAETTVEVGSGQSFAIAGLMSNSQNQSIRKFPFLGDMPVLGSLFRSTQYQNDQSELVIVITPYIVTPSGEQQLALPTDGFAPPSEADFLIGQRRSASDPRARTMSGDAPALQIQPAANQNNAAAGTVVTKSGFVVE